MGAGAAKKDLWKISNVCMLPRYVPLSAARWRGAGRVQQLLTEKSRKEKGRICQEEMQSGLWLGMINSRCCSELWV